jgi:hypothetical protein
VNTTREYEVLGSQPRLLDPLLNRIAGRRCDLELHWALRLVLHHHGSGCHLVTVTDIPDLQAHEVAAAKLAVDSQVEECELTHPVFHLKADSERPDVLDLERCFLANDLALVPRFAMNGVGCGFHDGLPSS